MKIHYTDNYLLNPRHALTVAVIGAGGTGSQTMQALGRIDHALYRLGHPGLSVTVYDHDIVTDANIGRQLFTLDDTGRYKAEVLATRINSFYGTSWDCVTEPYPFEKAPTHNIYVTCVDNAAARLEIGKYIRNNISGQEDTRPYYWLDMGNQVDRGQVVLGTLQKVSQPKNNKAVGQLKCVDQLFDLSSVDERDSGPSCSLAEALTKQDLFINSIIADIGSNLLWKLISCGSILNHGAYLNLSTMQVNPIRI